MRILAVYLILQTILVVMHFGGYKVMPLWVVWFPTLLILILICIVIGVGYILYLLGEFQ